MHSSDSINRRLFFTRTITGLGGLSLAASSLAQTDDAPPVITRTLGRTGITLPVVSMGVMNASIPDVLKQSYYHGVRHFDTAWYYQRGRNEEMVGQVIRELDVRREVTIATKIFLGDIWRDNTKPETLKKTFLKRVDESLRRLQMDHVDILYHHAIEEPGQLQIEALNEAMEQVRKQGKVRFTGVSTHANQTAVIEEIIKSDAFDVILVAYNFAMAGNTALKKAMQKAADQGIGLIAMKTQAGGGWWRDSLQKTEAFQGELNQTAMLKWVLNHQFITTAIPGYTNFQHMAQNTSVARNLTYTPEETQFLKDRQIPVQLGYCHQCGQCRSTCSQAVSIPELMRVSMYAFQYNNMEQAYAAYQQIDNHANLNVCASCSACTAACANSVPIDSRINALNRLNLA